MERKKLSIDRAIIVEGKYDRLRLSLVTSATVITTEGFGIFKEKEKTALIKRLAMEKGIILLTDSDGAGLVIRNYFRSIIKGDRIIHLYIPSVKGKEKRKSEPSREGLLGVEGMDISLLYELLLPYSTDRKENEGCQNTYEYLDSVRLYKDGFSGGEGSAERRRALARALDIPENLSTKAMIAAVNMLGGIPLYENALNKLGELNGK